MSTPDPEPSPWRVHPTVDRAAAYSWRLLVIAAVVVGLLWLAGQLQVVLIPVVVAVFAGRVLWAPARWLRARRWPPALAAAAVVVGALVVVGGVGALMAPSLADQFAELGPTLTDAGDDLETWLVEDSPFDVSPTDIDRWKDQAGEAVSTWLRSSDSSVTSRASLLVEIPTGLLLSLVLTFFVVKDGERFASWARDRLPARRRPTADRVGVRMWETLAGFLRGAAMLGAVEAVAIGVTVFAVGGELVLPIMVLTFAAAFVPIVGAIVAGVVAVLVTLVTAGVGPAVIVAVVALVVQQLDNDLLAPVIYGRALQLHPVIVLVSIVAGGALFGFVGAVLAVPLTAVAINGVVAARADPDQPGGPGLSPTGDAGDR
jgi:predicted PurR-regulated permease PerM